MRGEPCKNFLLTLFGDNHQAKFGRCTIRTGPQIGALGLCRLGWVIVNTGMCRTIRHSALKSVFFSLKYHFSFCFSYSFGGIFVLVLQVRTPGTYIINQLVRIIIPVIIANTTQFAVRRVA